MPERTGLIYQERKERPERCRLVFTGIGAITPIGLNAQETWNNLLAKVNKAKTIVDDRFKARVAVPIEDYNPLDYFSVRDLKRLSRATQFSSIACKEAMIDAGIMAEDGKLVRSISPMRAGVHIGTGIGGIQDYAETSKVIDLLGPKKVDPFAVLRILPERVTTVPSMERGLSGWSGTTIVACATGAVNIAQAGILIQADKADIMLCGGAEGTLTEVVMSGFGNMRALPSEFNEAPQRASRPFNLDSRGFVPSEGSAIFLLEELNHAIGRNAKIYAELAGMHCSADAYDPVIPNSPIIAKTIEIALEDAKLEPSEVDLIITHATSTGISEESEIEAVRKVFGEQLKDVKITAPKSIVGHSLGAAGAINVLVAIKSIQEGVVPPTINLDNRDPKFADLDIVTEPIECELKACLVNAFGFGGINSVLVIKKYQE